MNYEIIKKALVKYDATEVNRYINYLNQLETEKKDNQIKNKWFPFFKDQQAIDLYKNVAIDNLAIDGDTITIQNKGKIMVSYNYQAYKNRVLNVYPETIFDIQIVSKGDDFSFMKESGHVVYSHRIADPFNPNPEIIGTYCIIKNKRGEFLETLNMTEIKKMREVAKTKNVWDTWYSEMVLKSVIKRACKRHFKDITTNIENIDNDNYDLEKVGFDDTIQKKIEELKDITALNKLYKSEKANVSDEVKFVQLLQEKRSELMELLPDIQESDYNEATEMLNNGYKPDQLLYKWKINQDVMETLISKAT
jgi:hypothetical protein